MCVSSAHCSQPKLSECNYHCEIRMPNNRSYNTACCKDVAPIDREMLCFLPDIMKEIQYLRDRHQDMVSKSRRLWRLSQPRTRTRPYREPCVCPDVVNRKVEILHLDDKPVYTRTEQLAFPRVRSLSSLKSQQSFGLFNDSRKSSVNRMMRKSLYSLYSRLSNVQPPQEKVPVTKWSDKDWTDHMKRIGALAKPKTYQTKKAARKIKQKAPPPPKPKPVVTYPGTQKKPNPRRFSKLARPKKFEEHPEIKWQLTSGLRNFVASTRLQQLAKPKINYGYEERITKVTVKQAALQYKATPRIRVLATPSKTRNLRNSDTRDSPFITPRSALRAKASKRMQDLAQPREFYDAHTRENPYKVSRRALEARISSRLIELAQPRRINADAPKRHVGVE